MRFELSHDTIARQVFDKASAEAQARRKIEKYIRDRHAMYVERKALLTQDDLDYIHPHLDAIRPNAAEIGFIEASERALRRARNLRRFTVAAVMAVLAIATVISLASRATAREQAALATSRALISRSTNAIDDGVADLGALLAVEASLSDGSPEARSPLLTWHVSNLDIEGYLVGHHDAVRSLAFSPDGATLASASWDRTVMVWDVKKHVPRDTLRGHHDEVREVAFSPDGRMLASAGMDSVVILWDAATWKPIGEPLRHSGSVLSVAFAPDGKSLAAGTTNGTVEVWDVAATRRRLALVVPRPTSVSGNEARWDAGVYSVAYSQDGRALGAGGVGARVVTWDASTFAVLVGTPEAYGTVNRVAFSPSGKIIATGSGVYGVDLWNRRTGRLLKRLLSRGTSGYGTDDIAFSPSGSTLTVAARDGTVTDWDLLLLDDGLATPSAPRRLHTGAVLALAWSPDGKTVASGGEDGEIVLRVRGGAGGAVTLEHHASPSSTVAFSPDGRLLASGHDRSIILWDVARRTTKDTLVTRGGRVLSVAFSPDGATLAAGGQDSSVVLWDVSRRQPRDTLRLHRGAVMGLAFSPNGKTLVSAGADSQLVLWDVATGKGITQLGGHTGKVLQVAFSSDGRHIVSGSDDELAILWDVEGKEEAMPMLSDGGTTMDVAFSPDGRLAVTASLSGPTNLWDVARQRKIASLRNNGAYGIAVSPDGGTIAASQAHVVCDGNGCREIFGAGDVALWDVGRRQLRGRLPSPPRGEVAFSPDGNTLAAAGHQRNPDVMMWDLSPATLQARACAIAGRNFSLAEWRQNFGADTPYRRTCAEWPPGEGAPAGAPVSKTR